MRISWRAKLNGKLKIDWTFSLILRFVRLVFTLNTSMCVRRQFASKPIWLCWYHFVEKDTTYTFHNSHGKFIKRISLLHCCKEEKFVFLPHIILFTLHNTCLLANNIVLAPSASGKASLTLTKIRHETHSCVLWMTEKMTALTVSSSFVVTLTRLNEIDFSKNIRVCSHSKARMLLKTLKKIPTELFCVILSQWHSWHGGQDDEVQRGLSGSSSSGSHHTQESEGILKCWNP